MLEPPKARSQAELICAYCGYTLALTPDGLPLVAAERDMATHIAHCDKHPLAVLRRQYEAVQTALGDIIEAERRWHHAPNATEANIWAKALRKRCEAAKQLIPEDF